MTFPRLGVVTGAERADAVAPLLQALSDRCHVVAWHPGLPVDAVFVASWRAPRALDASKEAGGRVVLWDDAGDPPEEWRDRATITISTPELAVDVRLFRATAPFMRERWRGRFDIELPVELPTGLSWRQRRTFLALCPAVVATGTTALEALAFATPLVTDSATASLLGGTDRADMLVSDESQTQKVALAEDLGDDHRRAAALGRAGRRLGRRAPRSQPQRGRGDPSPRVGGRGRACDRSPRRPADPASVSSDHPRGSPRRGAQ